MSGAARSISGGRGGEKPRWRRCSVSGASWVVEEVGDVETELLGASARLGVAGADDGDGKCGGRSFGFERGKATEDGRDG